MSSESAENIRAKLKKLRQEIVSLQDVVREERDKRLAALSDPFTALVGTVGNLEVAFPVEKVEEVLPRVFLTEVPGSEETFAGYLQWRGIQVPVIDPSALWNGRPLSVRLDDRIVVFSFSSGLRAMLLTSVETLVDIPKHQLGEIPADISAAPYALALWFSGEKNALVIWPETLAEGVTAIPPPNAG